MLGEFRRQATAGAWVGEGRGGVERKERRLEVGYGQLARMRRALVYY